MNTKKFLKAVIIFISTLIIGFGITAVSFGLFESLTQNQMRILFCLDIVTLLAIGTCAWHFSQSKKQRIKREQELKARHEKRVELRETQYKDIEIIIAKNKFAA